MVYFIPVNNRKAGLIMVLAMLIIGFIDNYIAVIAKTASLWQFQIMRAGLAPVSYTHLTLPTKA